MKKINRIMVEILHDPITSMSEDEAKMYPGRWHTQNEDWCYVGVKAKAEIATGNNLCWLSNAVYSSGLWGIESNSEKAYFQEVAEEQVDELVAVLKELGFEDYEIPTKQVDGRILTINWGWNDKTCMVDI